MIDRDKFDALFDKWAEVARDHGVELGPLIRENIYQQVLSLEAD